MHLSTHASRHLHNRVQLIGRIATADEIIAQLTDGIPSGKSINGTRGTLTQSWFWTVKHAMTQSVPAVTVKHLQYSNQHQEVDVIVNSLSASTCCMTVPSPTCHKFQLHVPHTSRKVKCTLVQALRLCTNCTANRGSRGIAILYRHCGSVQAVRPIGGVEVQLYCTGTEALYRPYGQ